ncbi:MAG: imidazoleglycerol-phosphate dehydratase HisB [Candidatus Sumerlaeota bacterium]|nr:imidazoleglycerol-phosphate dehydratase HisB [Candidatus Sumerlaeota bacterium]
MTARTSAIERATKETQLKLSLNLDGSGRFEGSVGVPFLEHMLDLMTRQALFDLTIGGKGDLAVDAHHTVEDLGICLGQALKEALGDKSGIQRFGEANVPMEEALGFVALDACNRPFLAFKADLPKTKVGDFDVELIEEFIRAFVVNAGLTAHFRLEYGSNLHHCAEALFKALGRALGQAVARNPRIKGPHSTKGIL